MKWLIPAKTFLVGEYAAVDGGSSILLTTTPCFEMILTEEEHNEGIHSDSPAGRWWVTHRMPSKSLKWQDPYCGRGGVGASSAQFIGAYMASCHLLRINPSRQVLLDAYFQSCWRGEGLRPSGYDVLAQTQHRCVFINRKSQLMKTYDWQFKDISFLLVHSGQKLATHYHLQKIILPRSVGHLSDIVEEARQAFEYQRSEQLIQAVQAYHQQLSTMNLVAIHSQNLLNVLKSKYNILAAKGCGAMGADVLLLIIPTAQLHTIRQDLHEDGWSVLASNEDLYTGKMLLKNNPPKTLEILP